MIKVAYLYLASKLETEKNKEKRKKKTKEQVNSREPSRMAL